MFQFNFLDNTVTSNEHSNTSESDSCNPHNAKEVFPNPSVFTQTVDNVRTLSYSDNLDIRLISDVTFPSNSLLSTAESNHSDLLAGVYEGGLKIWECTHDLAKFIVNENLNLTNKNVLDLGCGGGIIGIIACVRGAEVCFQDYNEDVISYFTIPNVHLNSQTKKSRFYSGDWESFSSIVCTQYDIIFTCETVYNPDNYSKLCKVFAQCLKPNGFIYLAAKGHYFGCGGGLNDFVEFLKHKTEFRSETCWKYSNGLERAILKIYF
ncbi:hypothetical protein RI129_006684 [Pyrocoelia pectoralis]|uniref:protein-histidine N-methyltransferase n=1 Tax=Pyrocoelia pectoralis TaxID=417401 RepID=A0AAN7VFP4_9COLE